MQYPPTAPQPDPRLLCLPPTSPLGGHSTRRTCGLPHTTAASYPAARLLLPQPHIASYDYFLGEGMARVVEGLESIELEHPITKQRHLFWFENAAVGRPVRDDVATINPRRHILLPRDCREGVSAVGRAGRRVHWRLAALTDGGMSGGMTHMLLHLPPVAHCVR